MPLTFPQHPQVLPTPKCSCFPIFIVAKSQLTLSWPGTEPSGLRPFLIGSAKGEVDGESDLSRGRCWQGRGGVQWACAASPLGQALSLGTLPPPPSASPAQERPAKLPSFLPLGSTSIQGRIIPGGHTMALISRGARHRDPAHTKSHIFPVSTQRVRAGPRAAIS